MSVKNVIHCARTGESPRASRATGKSVWSTGLMNVYPGMNSGATKARTTPTIKARPAHRIAIVSPLTPTLMDPSPRKPQAAIQLVPEA